MSSSYSSLDWVLSHWTHFTVRRFIIVFMCVGYFVFFCQLRMCYIIVTRRDGRDGTETRSLGLVFL